MPLYEFIVTSRCSSPTQTLTLLKLIATVIFQEGGNVRGIKILGDRIMAKKLIGNDGAQHLVGRYIQVLYDGHPQMFEKLRVQTKENFETLRVNQFRVKDFINEAIQFTKPLEEEAPFIKNKEVDSYQYARALQVLKEERAKI